jgi:hypothetical protein
MRVKGEVVGVGGQGIGKKEFCVNGLVHQRGGLSQMFGGEEQTCPPILRTRVEGGLVARQLLAPAVPDEYGIHRLLSTELPNGNDNGSSEDKGVGSKEDYILGVGEFSAISSSPRDSKALQHSCSSSTPGSSIRKGKWPREQGSLGWYTPCNSEDCPKSGRRHSSGVGRIPLEENPI